VAAGSFESGGGGKFRIKLLKKGAVVKLRETLATNLSVRGKPKC
jgi:hypothetical protein